jgi:hypothetical protein
MLSIEAMEAILGISGKTILEPKEMAPRLHVTFYDSPHVIETDPSVQSFRIELEIALKNIGVHIHPYQDCIVKRPLKKVFKYAFSIAYNNITYLVKRAVGKINAFDHFISYKTAKTILNRRKIRDGVTIFTIAPLPTEDLPINLISSFKKSSIVSIIKRPKSINSYSPFKSHFDTAMSMFAEHMCNIVLLVDEHECTLYNFNASHPTFHRGATLKNDLLQKLIPKIYAPIRPLRLKDTTVHSHGFDISSEKIAPHVSDFLKAASVFSETNLYPDGKSIATLPFRNDFHRWVGKMHLDDRTGMSYGFLAKQLPQEIPQLLTENDFLKLYSLKKAPEHDYFLLHGLPFISLLIKSKRYFMEVPEVKVLSLRSGSKKTNFDPITDFVLLSLKHGKVHITPPKGLRISSSYKPSFDTHVILAHAIGTIILASVLGHFKKQHAFLKTITKDGQGIVHWHGYVNPEILNSEWLIYGNDKPHVACSSPQSAIFALEGKLKILDDAAYSDAWEIKNTLHIEPHHGSNAIFSTLSAASIFLKDASHNVSLGNQYLDRYKNQ